MSEQASLPSWPDILPTMFRNPVFRQFDRYRWRANIYGTKTGIVVASRSWKFRNHALGKVDFDPLLEAKRTGKLAAAFVVTAKVSPRRGTRRLSMKRASLSVAATYRTSSR
jgi:hypothetical protein